MGANPYRLLPNTTINDLVYWQYETMARKYGTFNVKCLYTPKIMIYSDNL